MCKNSREEEEGRMQSKSVNEIIIITTTKTKRNPIQFCPLVDDGSVDSLTPPCRRLFLPNSPSDRGDNYSHTVVSEKCPGHLRRDCCTHTVDDQPNSPPHTGMKMQPEPFALFVVVWPFCNS